MDRVTKTLLGIIAAALLAIAAHMYTVPPTTVRAQTTESQFYVEPGVYMLRIPQGGQVYGKVVTDLISGNVWGFPTNSIDPYPVSPLDAKPLVSHPIRLGKYSLGETDAGQ
jgi:hypothetical protein